jgi:tRNA-dependent cyclodipeptide synthase
MVSIKNRQFTDKLIETFCHFAQRHLRSGYLTVVDQPYLSNVRAMVRNPEEAAARAAGVLRLSAERRRQVGRLVGKFDPQRISVVPWERLVERTPDWITAEIRQAFSKRGNFHAAVLDQTRPRIAGPADLATLEAHAEFLLNEAPVLLYCYYLFNGQIADFYPGPQADFLWRIERGEFASELPQITALASQHAGQIYVEIATRT